MLKLPLPKKKVRETLIVMAKNHLLHSISSIFFVAALSVVFA